jgi:hypothetical protein
MIKSKNYIQGSDWWLNSENLSFSSILSQSKMPDHWARYISDHSKNINSLLTPVNKYVFSLYPRPKVLKINNGVVTFRQKTHAEIWIEEKNKNVLYALDKCHQRQFYPSTNSIDSQECFIPTYRFYIPWFINKGVEVRIDPVVDEDTPFYVNKKIFIGTQIESSTVYADTEFIDFKIKNTGKYFLKEGYGIISKNTPMYDMSVVLNNEEIERIMYDYRQ